MKKQWSLSTTVRNPERIFGFLATLQEMEGEDFDTTGQIKFQTLLIQNRLYRSNGLTSEQENYYDTSEDKMTSSQAQDLYQHLKNTTTEGSSPGFRGRNSVAALTKMGLAIARKTSGPVQITSLGNQLLKEEIDLGDVFFRFFLKYQIPNPDSTDHKLENGHDIKPFLGVLHLIDAVNRRSDKPVGLSFDEFNIFCPTLVNYKYIEKYADKIIELRKKKQGKPLQEQKVLFDKYKEQFAQEFLESSDPKKVKKLLNNLKDYGDNARRYLRMTRYFQIRGNGRYIDHQERRSVEIKNLLQSDNAKSLVFNSKEEYQDYLHDISQPKLPWETKEKYIEIIENLLSHQEKYVNKPGIAQKTVKPYMQFSERELKEYVPELRNDLIELQSKETYQKSQNIDTIKEYINELEQINSYKEDQQTRALRLEKYTALAFNAFNDALHIKPNYPVGDDNEPTFTAPANVPDIECFYEKYNALCEVTMLKSRDQWYNEGQPVMRHLRDFENKTQEKATYCLFIAPKLHRDTINTFHTSVKYEYEGRPQKIIPLKITDLINLLEILIELKKKNIFLPHNELLKLYDEIIEKGKTNTSEDWVITIPDLIESWKITLLNT